jgi:hypothetical protein
MSEPGFVTQSDGMTKGPKLGRPSIRKDGVPMTGAEREARRRARKGKSINRRRRTLRKQKKQDDEARLRRERSRNAPPLPDGADLRIGDCREVLADVADNSIPLILTDPPYGKDAEPLYRWLAQFAARVLIPGGSLICYTGQACLPRDFAIFGAHLTWQWLCTMRHTQPQRLFGANVIVTHKPVLWYVKQFRRGRSLMPDGLISPHRDKLSHAWAQGEGGIWAPIEHLTEPGEVIVDPFAGTGAWGRIAVQMGRRWIGADIVEGGTTAVAA